jgi:hypothetical protein
MKILAHIPLYYPNHCSGAEATARDLFKALIDAGHEVRINVDSGRVEEFEGIKITRYNLINNEKKHLLDLYKWCDVVYTHLGSIGFVDNITTFALNKPVVYYAHNSHRSSSVARRKHFSVVYNSEWVYKELKPHYGNRYDLICSPIVNFDNLSKSKKGDKITLINANDNKGGGVFREIARRMPKEKFLIVKGSYGEQLLLDLPDNVEVVENTPNISEVYEQTKILLMPSLYESFGRTAIEASWLGIPVIACPTKGLTESLGTEYGNFVLRNDLDGWVNEINRINKNYKAESEKAKQIGVNANIKMSNDKENFVKFVENIVK